MDRDTARTLLEESRRHMDATLRAVADLDRKAVELVKMDGVGLGLTATALGIAARRGPDEMGPMAGALLAAGILGVAGLIASMALAVAALFRRDLALGVIDLGEGIDLRYPDTIGFTLETHRDAVEANRAAINAKGRLVERGVAALLAASLLLGASAIGYMILEVL